MYHVAVCSAGLLITSVFHSYLLLIRKTVLGASLKPMAVVIATTSSPILVLVSLKRPLIQSTYPTQPLDLLQHLSNLKWFCNKQVILRLRKTICSLVLLSMYLAFEQIPKLFPSISLIISVPIVRFCYLKLQPIHSHLLDLLYTINYERL